MTTLEKLNQLYAATRLAPLTADQHDAVRKLASEIAEELKPKEDAEE
jgi:hypothetical protein